MSDDRDTTIGELKDLVEAFVEERHWRQFHNAKNLAMSIAIETAELMEHFQWLRTEQLEQIRGDNLLMGQVREELADIFCYLLSFASSMDIDLATALKDKMVLNRKKYPAEHYHGRFKL